MEKDDCADAESTLVPSSWLLSASPISNSETATATLRAEAPSLTGAGERLSFGSRSSLQRTTGAHPATTHPT